MSSTKDALESIDKRRKIADQLINQLDEQLVECKEEMKRLQHSSADQEAVIAHAKILLGHKKMYQEQIYILNNQALNLLQVESVSQSLKEAPKKGES
ncbi:hypothetical protein Lser_V15G43312 [Lactuca serriola]